MKSSKMALLPTRCRFSLQPRDFEFIARVLAPGAPADASALIGLMQDPDSIDAILDHPKLLDAVVALASPIDISAELYFYVLVRHVLKQNGIKDIETADYVAATLADFAGGDGPLRPRRGEAFSDVPYHVDFVEALQQASTYEQFYLHVRCGNQFLVLTGLFPRFLEKREERRGAPGVRYYEGVARESFRSAGDHPLADEFDLRTVYGLLAEEFPRTRKALNHMAREFLWLGN